MADTTYICTICGVQYAPAERPPAHCPICEDERQYVNPAGQSWTTRRRCAQAGGEVARLAISAERYLKAIGD